MTEQTGRDAPTGNGRVVLSKGGSTGGRMEMGMDYLKALSRDTITPEERWNMIAIAAYFLAEQRGFIGGSPSEDWIAAEKEIDSLLDGNKQ